MLIKFLYKEITCDKDIDIIYLPSTGQIVSAFNGEVIRKLPALEFKPYIFFKLVFDSYIYELFYHPKTGTYQKEMTKKLYYLNIYFDIDQILMKQFNEVFRKTEVLRKTIMVYLAILQIIEVTRKKNYSTSINNIGTFINYRESKKMYFISWKLFRFNPAYDFDMIKKKFIPHQPSNRIYFKRKGGIIETNNPQKLITSHFLETTHNNNDLVILPKNMSNLWKNVEILTYDELLTFSKSRFKKIYHKIWNRLIIHECHLQFLPLIKKLLQTKMIKCKIIWIINTLPLRYYFSIDITPNKLNINNISSLSNLWMSFDNNKKKIYRKELVRLFFTKFNQYYTQVFYPNQLIIPSINIKLNEFEKNIYQEFNKYLFNWTNKLTNEEYNIYSKATDNKINHTTIKLFNSIITLILAVIKQKNIPYFFRKKVQNTMTYMNLVENRLKQLIKEHNYLEKIIPMMTENEDIQYIQEEIRSTKHYLDTSKSKMNNYQRYLEIQTPKKTEQILKETNCPICYSEENLIWTILICGHKICLECIINSLTRANECPICREFIITDKIAIIKETIPNYQSNLVNYFLGLDKCTLILTDLRALNQLIFRKEFKAIILDIHNVNIMKNLKKIKKINKILLVTHEKSDQKYLNNLIGYFQSFNIKPVIEQLKIIV